MSLHIPRDFNPEDTWPPRQKAADPLLDGAISKITELRDDVADIKQQMHRQTEAIEQVADLLATFKVLNAVARWIAAIAAAVAIIIAIIKTGGPR